MPQMGHGASQPYNVSSCITPVQVGKGKGKSSYRPSVPVHSPIIPISSTAGGASSSTAPQVSVGGTTSGFGFVTPYRRSRSPLSPGSESDQEEQDLEDQDSDSSVVNSRQRGLSDRHLSKTIAKEV